jgi:hypothetical protein
LCLKFHDLCTAKSRYLAEQLKEVPMTVVTQLNYSRWYSSQFDLYDIVIVE